MQGIELFGRAQTVRPVILRLDAGVHLLLKPGDPHLEEFVQVGAGDGEELEPLEQRVGVVSNLFQHA